MNYEERRVHHEVRRRLSRLGFGLVGFFGATYLSQFFVLFLCGILSLPLLESVTGTWLLSMGAMYLCGLPAFLLIVCPLSGKRPKTRPIRPVELLVYFCISFAALYLFNLVSTALTALTDSLFGSSSSSTATELIENSPLFLIFIFAVIIGPLVEEFMFRRVLIDRLLPFGEKFAILVSAVSFGLFHGNFAQFFYAAALGAIFAYLYCKSGKLRYPSLLHMAVNFCGSIVPILVTRWLEFDTLPDIGAMPPEELSLLLHKFFGLLAYSGVVLALVAAGMILFCFRIRKINFSAPMVEIPKEGRARLLLSPGVLLAALAIFGIFVLSFL